MKKIRIIALVLAVVLLLTGCSGLSFYDLWQELSTLQVTPFSEMQYTRPDVAKMEAELEKCQSLAASESRVKPVVDQVWVVYNLYNNFHTNYSLASIFYYQDLTNEKWEEEYNFCLQNASNVTAMLEEMFYTLADCPLRDKLEKDPSFGEGFFDNYEGESIWDETFLQLMEQEAALEEKYYQICADAQQTEYYSDEYFERYGAQMADIFVELVKIRQAIASHAGYPDYPSFAYDFYHKRDYTPQQAETYLRAIGKELTPLYKTALNTEMNLKFSSQSQTFAYLEGCVQAMGGIANTAFTAMKDAGLYDITSSSKKYNGSFEVYLVDYTSPYIFVNPKGYETDKLTFSHEFGHFCSDFAAHGSYAGIDVAEIFSQGMEYLSLCYGPEAGKLTQWKMTDSLAVFVEQSAYALFEHQVYHLTGSELTVENVQNLYTEIGTQFGFDSRHWDPRDYALVSHFFIEPLYVVSYVTSNDAALQLYQMEQAEKGSGLSLWEKNLATEEAFFLAFIESAGLKSPFAPDRVAEIRDTFTSALSK